MKTAPATLAKDGPELVIPLNYTPSIVKMALINQAWCALPAIDGKPQQCTDAQLDAAVAAGGRELWRGTTPHSGMTGSQINQQFRDGKGRMSPGIYGAGWYFSASQSTARDVYSDPADPGSLMRAVLPPNARTITYPDLTAMMAADRQLQEYGHKSADILIQLRASRAELRTAIIDQHRPHQLLTADPGIYAALQGYSAVIVPVADGPDEVIVLSRDALLVDDGRTEACLAPKHPGPCKGSRRKQAQDCSQKCSELPRGPQYVRCLSQCNRGGEGPVKDTGNRRSAGGGGPKAKKKKHQKNTGRTLINPKRTGMSHEPPQSDLSMFEGNRDAGMPPRTTATLTIAGKPVTFTLGEHGCYDETGTRVENCLHPIVHPGPCKGWKKKVVSTTAPRATPSPSKASSGRRKTGLRHLINKLDYAAVAARSPGGTGPGASRGDDQLKYIAEKQGFDALPAVGNATDLDNLEARGGIRLFKGMSSSGSSTGKQYADQFRSGDVFYGQSALGNGIVTQGSKNSAQRRAPGANDEVLEMVLHPDAKIITRDELKATIEPKQLRKWKAHQQHLMRQVKNAKTPADRQAALDEYNTWQDGESVRQAILNDPGKFAAASGFDAIADKDPVTGNYEKVTVLNRSALLVHDPSVESGHVLTPRSASPAPTTPTAGGPGRRRATGAPAGTSTAPTAPVSPTPAIPQRVIGQDLRDKLDYRRISVLSKNNKGRDMMLTEIATQQGFDGPPELGDKKELDALIKQGGLEIWRGTKDYYDYTNNKRISGAELARQFRTGDAFYGQGIYGNGIYTSTSKARVQSDYLTHRGDTAALNRMVLKPGSKTIDYDDLRREVSAQPYYGNYNAAQKRWLDSMRAATNASDYDYSLQQLRSTAGSVDDRDVTLADMSSYAMAQGYDAITIKPGSNWMGVVTPILLNRTAVMVERKPGD